RPRRRGALARLLARDAGSEDEVADLGRAIGWRRPAAVAAIVASTTAADRLGARLGDGALAVAEESVTLAFVPDPDGPGRRAQIERALDGVPAALGPSVAVGRTHHSLARAR